MLAVGLALSIGINTVVKWQPFQVQFVRSGYGQSVQVRLDGVVKTSYAGKMLIRDRRGHVRTSYCANVRGPVAQGQVYGVTPFPTRAFGGTVQLAGNIVAGAFGHAQTPAQCAGLQIAIWECVEDGGRSPDFDAGSFQVRGSAEALNWARTYYELIETPGDATFLQQDDGGQSQIFV